MTKIVEEKKERFIGIRVTEDQYRLFQLLAKEQNVSVSEFLRSGVVNFAEKFVESQQVLESVEDKDKKAAQQTIHAMITEVRGVLANSIQQSDERVCRRVEHMQKLLEAFLYAYLYHTPEIPEEMKKEAKRSALARQKRVLELMSLRNQQNTGP